MYVNLLLFEIELGFALGLKIVSSCVVCVSIFQMQRFSLKNILMYFLFGVFSFFLGLCFKEDLLTIVITDFLKVRFFIKLYKSRILKAIWS